MKREEIYLRIKEIVKVTLKGEVDIQNIDEKTDLVNDIGIDSIAGIEILVRIENEFQIEIDDEDLSIELIRNFSTIADYVEARI
jgi:acyl carrier protein